MDYSAKVAMWEGCVALMVDAPAYEALLSARSGGKMRLEIVEEERQLLVGLTPDAASPHTLVPTERQSLPFMIRARTSNFSTAVCDHLQRFGVMSLELSGGRLGLSGAFDLVPHLRPWPKLRQCKKYDLATRSVEVYKERILSTAAAGHVWCVPPREFMERCPKSFMTIWGEMPEGLELRMEDGHVHRR